MTSTYANEAKSAIDNAVAPQKPEKLIPLIENSRGMFRDVIDEFGINDGQPHRACVLKTIFEKVS